MADIRESGWEWLHYDHPDFQVMYRKNEIPANCVIDGISMHWHDDVEFIYVVEGAVYYYVNEEKVLIPAGEGIFVNARQKHLIEASSLDCVLYCLIFHPTILCSSEYVAVNCVMPLLESRELPYLILSEKEPWQDTILQTIKAMQSYAEEKTGHMQMMRAVFEIWDGLYQNLISRPETEEELSKDLICVKKMVDFIHKHYHEKVTLGRICEAGNVGKTKCNMLFDAYYNLTPIEFLRNYRIEKGAKLLEITDMSITEIAFETGFNDASYFSKTFGKQIGCSPQNYRSYRKGLSKYYE